MSAKYSQQQRANFRFRKDWVHLTYAQHVNIETLKNLFEEKGGGLKWFSGVNETSEDGHKHCHFACQWNRQIDTASPRYFDLPQNLSEGIGGHPNIQAINNREHAIRIYDEYHKKDGEPLQSSTRPGTALTIIQQVIQAKTLYEGCAILGIEPTTVSDVKMLRSDIAKPDDYVHKFRDSNTWTEEAQDIPTTFKTLFLSGVTGTGKTQWAINHFNNPLICSQRDDLRNFDPKRHDGIIFDDMSFKDWTRTECIHLCDWDEQRSVRCRYTDAVIPPKTRKIFTSNLSWWEVFPDDETRAIRRRITNFYTVKGSLYVAAPPPDLSMPIGDDYDYSEAPRPKYARTFDASLQTEKEQAQRQSSSNGIANSSLVGFTNPAKLNRQITGTFDVPIFNMADYDLDTIGENLPFGKSISEYGDLEHCLL